MERHVVHELVTRHDHPGYPEEDDVRSGHEVVGWIIVCKVGVGLVVGVAGHLRVEHGDGPQPAGEPGVQDVLVLLEVLGLDGRIDGLGSLEGFLEAILDNYLPIREIICRNPLTPPQLAADAPIACVLHPVTVGIAILVRDELDETVLDRGKGARRQLAHLEEPLGAQTRLNDGIGALAVSYRRGIVLNLLDIAGVLEHLDDLPAGLETVLAYQDLGVFGQASAVVDDIDDREVVTQADLIVVSVMRRRDLEAAGTEIHLDIVVLDDGYLLVDERDKDFLALHPEMALVIGVDADGGIGHDGLRTRRGHHDVFVGRIAVTVGDEVAHVVEMALGVLVDDLVVTDGGVALRVPVDHSHSPVDPSLLVEIHEGVDDGLGELRLHGEAGAVPVAGSAELAQLLEYDASVLLLPLPGILEELLSGKRLLGDAHALELGHNLVLGGDGSVVGTGDPAGVPAVHAGLADEHVVECIVEHMSHVQDAGDVRRRDHDGIRLPVVGFGMEAFMLQPVGVPLVLHFGGNVFCR